MDILVTLESRSPLLHCILAPSNEMFLTTVRVIVDSMYSPALITTALMPVVSTAGVLSSEELLNVSIVAFPPGRVTVHVKLLPVMQLYDSVSPGHPISGLETFLPAGVMKTIPETEKEVCIQGH